MSGTGGAGGGGGGGTGSVDGVRSGTGACTDCVRTGGAISGASTAGELDCSRVGAVGSAAADFNIGAESVFEAGSIMRTDDMLLGSDCAAGWAASKAGNGRRCQAMPTANTIDAASAAGAIQRTRGLIWA